MHYITLDTNTWIYLANGTEPVKILHYIKEEVEKGAIKIILPSIIIKEWDKNKDNAVKKGALKHFQEIGESLDRFLRLLGTKGEKDILNFIFSNKDDDDKDYFKDFVEKYKEKKKEIEDAIVENINIIDNLFKHPKIEIVEIKEEIMLKATKFALEKKAPFLKKNSFADAVIFFCFIDFVQNNNIENAFFITYNTEDFCEKKDGKKHLHPDLELEIQESKSHFYTIVGEAINVIENILTKEELEWIKNIQEEAEMEERIEYCEVCLENNGWHNEIHFHWNPVELIDERMNCNKNQLEFEFSSLELKGFKEKYFDKLSIGHCSWCNTEHFKCANCGTVNPVEYDSKINCTGCDLIYYVDTKNDFEHIGEGYIYKILKELLICAKCGNEYEDDNSGTGLCWRCENEYGYGMN
jgi:hypothetical protein